MNGTAYRWASHQAQSVILRERDIHTGHWIESESERGTHWAVRERERGKMEERVCHPGSLRWREEIERITFFL